VLKQTIKDVDVSGKKVLVRVDFNVPQDKKTGNITDDSRIKAAMPSIQYLLDHDAKIILCSHLGRPDGKVVESLRLQPIADRLSQLISKKVEALKDCVGNDVVAKVNSMKNGDIVLLENVRFHTEEEKNDAVFAKAMASLADIYVDDAFGTAHRAHASTVGVANYLPAYAGFLMEKEIDSLGKILSNPEHPFTTVLGGAKVSDKIELIKNILTKIDILIIGGGMATNFLKADGYEVGLSKIEADKQDLAKELIKMCRENHIQLYLPVDVVVTAEISDAGKGTAVSIDKVSGNEYIVDIGPETVALFQDRFYGSKTIFWNGPMGIYEIPQFANGTRKLAQFLADSQMTTIVGGGSTAEIVEDLKLKDKMTHVSTGGGASLEFMEGKTLPGVAVLRDK
jgi:phosphoglycerate kinase